MELYTALACGEDEEDGQQGEGHDDPLHEPGGAGPAPAHPHAQRGGQDQHQQRDDQLLEGHHQLVARQQGACRGIQVSLLDNSVLNTEGVNLSKVYFAVY